MSYCDYARQDPLHQPYHDDLYGFPLHDDNELFGRLLLEINQAGLSWATILRKQAAFREAYSGFDIDTMGFVGALQRIDAEVQQNRKQIGRVNDWSDGRGERVNL